MASAVKFRQAKPAKQPGETARLKVVQGPDSGSTYVLTGARATMGRGEENDIVLSDLKSSRRHAEIGMDSRGGWFLKDLGSANGILFDGQVIREGAVKKGDRFTVGETQIEFTPGDGMMALLTQSQMQSHPTSLASSTQAAFAPTLAGLGSGHAVAAPAANVSGIAGLGGAAAGSQQMNPRMLIYVAIAALLFFMPDEETPAPKKKKDRKTKSDLSAFLPEYESSAKTGPAEMFFKEGFREYREKNYLRAKTQFETVLQIAPGHRLAAIYLRNSERAIEEEVESHLIQGKKDVEAGKLRSARGHYEAILRFLHRDPQHASYLEAKEAVQQVDKAMRGLANE